LETCCGSEYGWARGRPSLGFSRAVGNAPDHAKSAALARVAPPLRPSRFRGPTTSQKEKKSLSRIPAGVSKLVCVAASARAPVPDSWPGSLSSRRPFRRPTPPQSSDLGPTHPRTTAVPAEPCSSSVFKVPIRIVATTTKIRTSGASSRPRERPSAAPPRPPTCCLAKETTAEYRYHASAPSIFSASSFGR